MACAQCGTYVGVEYYEIPNINLCADCAYLGGSNGYEPSLREDERIYQDAVTNFETDEDTGDW